MFVCCNQVDDNNASWDAIDGLGKEEELGRGRVWAG